MESKVSDVQLRIIEPVVLPVIIPKEDISNVIVALPKVSIAIIPDKTSTSNLIIIHKKKQNVSNFLCPIILFILGIIIVIVMIL
jgi:hypothetical protein